jgi:hypothetical protein
MRTVLRTAIATAVASMTLASPALADTATVDLLLARDACGATDGVEPDPRLAFSLGQSTLGCGNMLAITGGSPEVYPAKQGMPVTLDPARPVDIGISITSYFGVLVGGIGPETVDVTLTGRKDGKPVTIGHATSTIPAEEMLTTAERVEQFDLPLKPEQGGEYTAITLELTVGGSELSGFVNHDGSSYVSLPVTDESVPEEPTDEES